MSEIIFESETAFEMRDFVIEAKVLLLRGRAPLGVKASYIDIKFLDVVYLDIPVSLRGIKIRQVTASEFSNSIFDNINGRHDFKQFVIESEGIEYAISSSGLSVYYVRADSFQSSIRRELKWSKIITTA